MQEMDTEAWGGKGTCPRLHSKSVAGLGVRLCVERGGNPSPDDLELLPDG